MAAADFQIEDGEGRATLRLTGDWSATELGRAIGERAGRMAEGIHRSVC